MRRGGSVGGHDQGPMSVQVLPRRRPPPSVCRAPIRHPAVTHPASDQQGRATRGEGASRADPRGDNYFRFLGLPITVKRSKSN